MKALVTGGGGVLGAALLVRLGSGAVGVSRSGAGGLRADLSDPSQVEALFAARRFDAVFHAAAWSDVDGCERDPGLAYACNALSTKHLAAACGRSGAVLVYVSTDYVFDGAKRSPYAEDDPTAPVNAYGMTKLAGEHFTAACASPAATVRTSWLFGAGNAKNFVNVLRERLLAGGPAAVLDDQTDAPTSASDLAGALERVARRLLDGARGHSLYQYCNSGEATRLEMARAMARALAPGVAVTRLDPGTLAGRLAIRPAYAVMSTARYQADFGERPRDWREALDEYLRTR